MTLICNEELTICSGCGHREPKSECWLGPLYDDYWSYGYWCQSCVESERRAANNLEMFCCFCLSLTIVITLMAVLS